MSKILENSGVCDIVLTAFSSFEHAGIEYAEDDVVLVLKDVPTILNYEMEEGSAVQGKATLAYRGRKVLQEVVVGQVPLTENLVGLFSTKSTIPLPHMTIHKAPASGNAIFLPQPLDIGHPFKVIELQPNKAVITYSGTYNQLISDAFEDGEVYTVCYFVPTSSSTYDVNDKNVHIPYLKMYISGSGNVDKESGRTSLYVPRVSIVDLPSLGIQKNEITYYNMRLKVIDDKCYMTF